MFFQEGQKVKYNSQNYFFKAEIQNGNLQDNDSILSYNWKIFTLYQHDSFSFAKKKKIDDISAKDAVLESHAILGNMVYIENFGTIKYSNISLYNTNIPARILTQGTHVTTAGKVENCDRKTYLLFRL